MTANNGSAEEPKGPPNPLTIAVHSNAGRILKIDVLDGTGAPFRSRTMGQIHVS
jgi:hypothetical protein